MQGRAEGGGLLLKSVVITLLLFVVGYAGWRVAVRAGIPSPAITGSLVAVSIVVTVSGLSGGVFSLVRLAIQVVIGASMGLRFGKERIALVRSLALPCALVSAWALSVAFAVGVILYETSSLDLVTCILGSAPGGIAEMSLLALSLPASPPAVAMLQLSRIVVVLLVIPYLAKRLVQVNTRTSGFHNVSKTTKNGAVCSQRPFLIVSGAVGGGLACHAIGIPVGGLIGSMVTVGLLKIFRLADGKMQDCLNKFAQVGIGVMVGQSFSQDVVANLVGILAPVTLLSLSMVVSGILMALVIRRLTGWDATTCLLSTAAAGMISIVAMAEEMECDALNVGLLHLVRLTTIIGVLPIAMTVLM